MKLLPPRILRLRTKGCTQVQIATALNVTVGVVAGVLRRTRTAPTPKPKKTRIRRKETPAMPPPTFVKTPPLPPSKVAPPLPPLPPPLPPKLDGSRKGPSTSSKSEPVAPQPTTGPKPEPVKPPLPFVLQAKSIIDLKQNECRYAVATAENSDGIEQHFFCGKTTAAGEAYCVECAKLCINPVKSPLRLGPARRYR